MDPIGNHLPAILREPTSSALDVARPLIENPNPSELQAAELADAIFGSYRRSDTDDPEIYYQAFKRLLGAYPLEIAIAVADPLTGIAGEQTFLPSPAELKASLDRRLAAATAKAKRDRDLKEQMRQRREFDARQAATTQEERDRAVRRYLEEIRPGIQAADVRAIDPAAWDAIPDAEPQHEAGA
jgi:hypothetical protein